MSTNENLPHIELLRRTRDFHERMLSVLDDALDAAVTTAKEFGFDVPTATATAGAGSGSQRRQRQQRSEPAPAESNQSQNRGNTKRRGRDGSKSQAIADFLRDNPEATARNVVEGLAENGIEVSQGLVSVVKSKLGKSGKRGGNSRSQAQAAPAPRAAKQDDGEEKRRGRKKSANSLASLIPVILRKHRSGLKLDDLVTKVVDAGYTYQGDKGRQGLSQIVYQTCYKLMQDETVKKDENSKRYMVAEAA